MELCLEQRSMQGQQLMPIVGGEERHRGVLSV